MSQRKVSHMGREFESSATAGMQPNLGDTLVTDVMANSLVLVNLKPSQPPVRKGRAYFEKPPPPKALGHKTRFNLPTDKFCMTN